LHAMGRRIVGLISDRFAHRRRQPAWPRAQWERRRNGPKSTWATASAAWAATSSITGRGAEWRTANRPRRSLAGARAPPYHARASPSRRQVGMRGPIHAQYAHPCQVAKLPVRRVA
jgi:hypothetical protein